jgi:hypothetical protein
MTLQFESGVVLGAYYDPDFRLLVFIDLVSIDADGSASIVALTAKQLVEMGITPEDLILSEGDEDGEDSDIAEILGDISDKFTGE